MFAKTKVTQSMIDAVNEVTKLDEASPIKEPTPTGMRVYGRNYGNSAKAKQDQTKSDLDKIKGPKDKEMKEAAKPDFLDLDGDKNEKESMKKAIADKGNKGVKEELKSETFEFHLTEGSYADLHKKWGDTHNIEYHSHTLYPKHTVTKFDNEKDAESHAKKTGGTVRMSVSPKMKNEELKGNQDKIDANKNNKVDAHDFAILRGKKKVKESFSVRLAEKYKAMKEKKDVVMPEALEKSPAKNTDVADKSYLKDKPGSVKSDLKNLGRFLTGKKETNEEVELTEEQLDEMINEVLGKDATAGDWISDFVHSDNPKFAGKSKAERKKMALGAYYGKQNEATIAGLSGWKKIKGTDMQGNVKDKSGATHTPMSRAKDLARSAFKKVQDRTKLDK